MKRWHEEYSRTYREWRKHYRCHVERNVAFSWVPGRDPYQVDCACDRQKGRFRKTHAGGCGRAGCQLCHPYKFPKRETTRKERRAEFAFREEIEELMASGLARSSLGSPAP